MDYENVLQARRPGKTCRRFAMLCQELLEGYVDDSEKLSQGILQLSNQQAKFERMQTESLHRLDTVKLLVAGIADKNNLLEKAGESHSLLARQHYDECIIEPMLRSLLPIFDVIEDHRRHNELDSGESSLIDSIWCQLLQFIANYNIEMFSHSSGDEFDPKIMKPVGWETTNQRHLENSIARSLQSGFKLGDSRILRQETVRLFKYELPKANSTSFNKEKDDVINSN